MQPALATNFYQADSEPNNMFSSKDILNHSLQINTMNFTPGFYVVTTKDESSRNMEYTKFLKQ